MMFIDYLPYILPPSLSNSVFSTKIFEEMKKKMKKVYKSRISIDTEGDSRVGSLKPYLGIIGEQHPVQIMIGMKRSNPDSDILRANVLKSRKPNQPTLFVLDTMMLRKKPKK